MSGRIDVLPYVVVAVSAIATLTDALKGKIYNWLTFPALVAGVVVSFALGGWTDGSESLLAVGAGLLLYGWMFVVGMMGAGDVKLLMALGAWGGLKYVAEVALLGVVLGGLMAGALLVAKGRALDFGGRLFRTLRSLLVKELEFESPKIDRKLKMPFGIAISAAAVWLALGDPFGMIGVRPW